MRLVTEGGRLRGRRDKEGSRTLVKRRARERGSLVKECVCKDSPGLSLARAFGSVGLFFFSLWCAIGHKSLVYVDFMDA